MIRLPPIATPTVTLFPYPTLFRSQSVERQLAERPSGQSRCGRAGAPARKGTRGYDDATDGTQLGDAAHPIRRRRAFRDRKSTRLNSVTNAHLVCRLLLEKNTRHDLTKRRPSKKVQKTKK